MAGLGIHLKLNTALLLACGVFMGCSSTDTGGDSVSAGVYYGTGFYDPWYHGAYYYPPGAVVPPPSIAPRPPQPAHPIATPPTSAPRPTPMPSIPSMPRPALRR